MNTNLKIVLGFVSGLGVGAFVGYKYCEKKMLVVMDERDSELHEHYMQKVSSGVMDVVVTDEEYEEIQQNNNDVPRKKYINKHEPVDYTQYAAEAESPEESDEITIAGIEYILEHEYDNFPGYETDTLTYFSDGYLINDTDEQIFEPTEIIGQALDELATNEDGVLYVRNHDLQIDYELLKSMRNYVEE